VPLADFRAGSAAMVAAERERLLAEKKKVAPAAPKS
jgi:hypothetical protein